MHNKETVHTYRCDLCGYEIINSDSKPHTPVLMTAYNLHPKENIKGVMLATEQELGCIHLCAWCSATINQQPQPEIG